MPPAVECFGAEARPESDLVYKELDTANSRRYYDFLNSMIRTAVSTSHSQVSHALIKAINFHAIVGLHQEAGVYRSTEVTVGNIKPAPAAKVQSLMDEFIAEVNGQRGKVASTVMGAYALWRINFIHPFVNGNGRTARAMCYFIICGSIGGELPGAPTIPELLSQERAEYVKLLQVADKGNIQPLTDLVSSLLSKQLSVCR